MTRGTKLIVTADDFGAREDVNMGICDAYTSGLVASTSLMMNGDRAWDAAALALKTPGLAVGLHLNISQGRCVAPPEQVGALVHPDGRFRFDQKDVPGSLSQLRQAIADDRRVLDQIECEAWAQVKKAKRLRLRLTHLDCHQYLSLIHPALFERYVDLANQLRLPFRGLCYPVVDTLSLSHADLEAMQGVLDNSNSPYPNISLSNLVEGKPEPRPTPGQYQEIVQSKLKDLSDAGTESIELITHPSRITDSVRNIDTYFWAREMETALVNSASFAQFLADNEFQIVRHADLP